MENFIEEILSQLIQEAEEIKAYASKDFEKGILVGYYESISKILNQTEVFDVLDKLPQSLQEYNPESLLE